MARRAGVWLAVLVCLAGFLSVLGAGGAAASTAGPAVTVPPVTHLSAGSVTASAVTLSWRWPSATLVTRAVVRMAQGSVAPASPTSGVASGAVTRPAHALRVGHLAAYARYTFAVFAKDKSGHYAKGQRVSIVTRPLPLKITIRALPAGVRGLFYIAVLPAAGGAAPYSWKAAGLPRGLSVSAAGMLSGYPRTTGTRMVTLRVKDARGAIAAAKLKLAVPTSLPAGCVAKSCAQLNRDPHTIQVPGKDIVTVIRSRSTGKVTSLVLSGVPAAAGDILVLPAAAAIPSGLIVVVGKVSASGRRQVLAVSQATPADAYYQGVVQTITSRPATPAPVAVPPGAVRLSCDGSVTAEVHGLALRPAIKASVALDWKHRLFGGKGIYLGYGGLKLFQFGLTGTVTVDLGASISGKARCTLKLPAIHDAVPAGDLGVVLVDYSPSLTLDTSGSVSVDTSVTLTCYAGYEWYRGSGHRTDYCTAAHRPLHLTTDSGLEATLTGAIGVSATLDDLPGIEGSIGDSLHLGYHPRQQPVAELDTSSDYELKATLAKLWKGAPTLPIAHGEFFNQVLATWGTPPPGDGGPPAITVTPTLAWPWNDSACGWDSPNGRFTVSGTGFQPGEKITISTGWATYPGTVTAAWDGSFTATNFVGEVPSVLYTTFTVTAQGSAGSEASSPITLDSNGCVSQADSGGTITLTWGGNGYDPGSEIDLYINDAFQGYTTADSLGTGGNTTSFTCPSSGTYLWQVDGTVNGGPVTTNDLTMYCSPSTRPAVRATAGASAGAVRSTHPVPRGTAANGGGRPLRVVRRELRTSLTANAGCWHARPMGIHATLALAPGCSPLRLRSEPTTSRPEADLTPRTPGIV